MAAAGNDHFPSVESAEFTIDITGTDHGVATVVLAGDLDLATVNVMNERLVHLQQGVECLRLDVSGLTFVDSAGLRALLILDKRYRGGVILVRPSAALGRLLSLTGLSSEFQLEHG